MSSMAIGQAEPSYLRRSSDIDPIFGKENFVWAPMKDVHTTEALEALLRDLRAADAAGSKDKVIRALQKAGERAAKQ